ncbi:MAG: stage III sporulation protein AF, partial [Sarcina sp.]
SIYNNDYLIETLENSLNQKLKLKYADKSFEVKINGTMDIDSMKADIKKVSIGVLDNKKIKKVEKVTIGEVESKVQQETPFFNEVKEMVCTELQISKEKINVWYI